MPEGFLYAVEGCTKTGAASLPMHVGNLWGYFYAFVHPKLRSDLVVVAADRFDSRLHARPDRVCPSGRRGVGQAGPSGARWCGLACQRPSQCPSRGTFALPVDWYLPTVAARDAKNDSVDADPPDFPSPSSPTVSHSPPRTSEIFSSSDTSCIKIHTERRSSSVSQRCGVGSAPRKHAFVKWLLSIPAILPTSCRAA
jgi:hypothetical protein